MSEPATPKFASRDPAQAEFWSERYAREFTPWDQQGVPPDLARALQAAPAASLLPAPPARVLLPGCGSGYELSRLSEAGYDPLAIDISPAAVARARSKAGAYGNRVCLADCFAMADEPAQHGRYAWIYERAFACALPPRLWPRWAAAMKALVGPGGVLAGFFHFDPDQAATAPERRRGPPFAMRPEELAALLGDDFRLLDSRPVAAADSIAVFRGKEAWMVWQRTARVPVSA